MLKLKDLSTEDFCRALNKPQLVSVSNKSRPKKQMTIDNETFIDILARANAISAKCKSQIIDLAAEGKTENELLRAITDIANGKVTTTQKAKGEVITSFKQIKDEDFFAGLSRPQLTAFTA